MYSVKDLLRPSNLEEALQMMKDHPEAMPLAGGTDVVVKMRKKAPKDVVLLSVAKIGEMKGIELLGDGTVSIGAASTFTEIAESPVINRFYPMLKTAALAMGGPQIQNVATIGGNVCNGAVSADSAPSLFALDARLVLRTADNERIIPIHEFYLGPGRVGRKEGELLVRILIQPKEQKFGGVYRKFATRKAMDLAILGVAGCVSIGDDDLISQASIALGVAAPTPIRCPEAEAYLIGKKPEPEVLKEVGELALKAANPRDSWRASKRYREALIKELSGRVIRDAYELAGGKI